jgi:hypothetical protein
MTERFTGDPVPPVVAGAGRGRRAEPVHGAIGA